MKDRICTFILNFVGYCIIFLVWNNWSLNTKQIAEMIFVGGWVSLIGALMFNPLKRLVENIVRHLFAKPGK